MKKALFGALAALLATPAMAAPRVLEKPSTYCNPVNLDYAYTQDRPLIAGTTPHRSSADPVFFSYQGKLYLFGTGQFGYWWSQDMAEWHFVAHDFEPNGVGDQVCAPGAWPTKRGVLFLPCFGEGETMPLYLGTDLLAGKWKEAVPSFPIAAWDPSFFQDDDGKIYAYWGSSNAFPLHGVELDAKYQPIGKPTDLIKLDPAHHGWEVFGENNVPMGIDPYIEGAWMNKFNGRYYLQYGAPGTEINVYGDGYYVSDHPLGPFKYQPSNPFSWKPTGFIRGAGHGSTFPDQAGRLWHAATMDICVKNKFERRIGIFPAFVDKQGVLAADTAFGDYPHTLPGVTGEKASRFPGWMLLSYKKKAWSDVPKSDPALAFDEDIKTYWTAPDGQAGHFLAVDLGHACDVNAIQVNYADEKATLHGKVLGLHHRYRIYASMDGKTWDVAVDKSRNMRDVPHDYVQFASPLHARYLKIENINVPTGCFAIGDLRVFGKAPGKAPGPVELFQVARERDRRIAHLDWSTVPGAYAYDIRYGVEPNKLTHSLLIYGDKHYDLRGLNDDQPYYFQIRAVAETGLSQKWALVNAL